MPSFYDYPHGFTLFCDDIRQEVGGKQTLVGVYNAIIYVFGDFPTVIPKLAFSTHYREPASLPVASTLTCSIFLEANGTEQLLTQSTLDLNAMRNGPGLRDLSVPGEPGKYSEGILNGLFSPLVIAAPSRLKVRAYRDGEEVRLGTLTIDKGTEADFAGLALGPGMGISGPLKPRVE